MTSNMLSREQRWASSRRGGMTVLGKVAVPKPINLPSQRLENHGLNPNVEIVPKGTLSWGSRPSFSASNAWGSSSLSPNTDSGTSSPSHLSARPSSGGSGTRPSTAGSDRALEPATNAWVSNSRPSSASGSLTSDQTSLTTLRPCSAETRPGSSQLSRFAEHTTENSVAWSAARSTEKLGVIQPKNDEFSLVSGDFPTLGSEKDKSVLNFELRDQSSYPRPGSSSELGKEKNETSAVDDVPVNANVKGEGVNSLTSKYQAYNEDGVRPCLEKWKGNSQPYPNAGIPPRHFDAWHGPPVNNPQGGVWFRGPPNGPPFGNPVAPGGFPIEPFPYYHPHIPPTGLANPPPGPPLIGPRGHHKNGDVYRPHISDAYIRPGMPMRPGFYPGPMAYEGYYSPPMGYCNSNEQDVPFMGMATGPSVCNRYSHQHPSEPGNSQVRSGAYGSAGKPLASEQVESCQPPDTVGPYKVLLKQHNEWDGKNEQSNSEDSKTTNISYADGRDQSRMPVWENGHRSNYRKNKEMDLRTSAYGEEASSQTLEDRGSSSSVIKAKSPEITGTIDKFDDIPARKLDGVSSNVLEIPARLSVLKDSSLIQKIEGLNAKARDNSYPKSKGDQRSKSNAASAPVNHVENEVGAGAVFAERTRANERINPTSREGGASGGEKNFESLSFNGTATSRQTAHGMQGRGDHHNKGRLNNQDADGWRQKSVVANLSSSSDASLETSNVLVGEHQISVDAYKRSGSYNQVRHGGESIQTISDPADGHDQHAKMKELAKQRTKQLQEEEEEWTRKQKAKALAKLDELNRRSQAVEGSTQKEYAIDSTLQNKQEELQPSELATVSGKSGAVDSSETCNSNVVCQIHDTNVNKVEKSSILSSEPPSETLRNTGQEPVLNDDQSVTLHHGVNSADATNALQVQNNIAPKPKRTGNKQKQDPPLEKTLNEKVLSTASTAPKVENNTVVDVTISSCIVTNEVGSACCGSRVPMNSTAIVESSVNQKKKNNRNGRNKNKVEEASSLTTLPSVIPKEAIISKVPVESDKPKEELDQGSLQPESLSKDSNQYSEQCRYSANEEYHGRMNSQLKSKHPRRMPRNIQVNRPAEKSHGIDAVMWAPVKPQNKTEFLDESSEKCKTEVVNPVKSDQQVHNFKNKRAEMERYVPKPVAKEMAQQGSIQQAASPISQAPTDESVGRHDTDSQGPQKTRHTNSALGKMGSGLESKNGDGRQTKQGKAHGSWRQRIPTESTNVNDMQSGLEHDLNSDHNVHLPMEPQQAQKSETSLTKGKTKHFNDSSEPDSSNNPDTHDSAAHASVPVTKDHRAMGKGRQVPFRGHKDVGVNHDVDHMKNAGVTEKIETLVPYPEHSQPDAGAALKENRSVGERMTSHWQPKYQASNNQRRNRANDHVGSEVVRVNKKDSIPHGRVSLPVDSDKEANTLLAQPHHDLSASEKSEAGEAPNFGDHVVKRERKHGPSKGRPRSPNQVAVSLSEEAPTSMDLRHEQRPSSGFRRNGNQYRFGRVHDSRGDWKFPPQDNRHYNQPTNRERQGTNSHYERHPVESYDDSKLGNSERPRDGNHVGGRFWDRSQTHSRRGGGNFHGH